MGVEDERPKPKCPECGNEDLRHDTSGSIDCTNCGATIEPASAMPEHVVDASKRLLGKFMQNNPQPDPDEE